MLYHLYTLTKNQLWFNQAARNLIIAFELPILKFIFNLAGAQKAIPRNSIYDSEHFNVFMSDIDFTIVAGKSQSDFIFTAADILKKIFPNLGEIEFHTLDEWIEIQSLQASKHWPIWNRIYLIRKISWQKIKLSNALIPYEKLKQERAIKVTLKKLEQYSYQLNGTKIFHDLDSDTHQIDLPQYSSFLEHQITTDQNLKEAIHFSSSLEAQSFLSILPDMDLVPQSLDLKEIKRLLIRREYLLCLASMRLKEYRKNSNPQSKDQQWLQDLDRRFHLLTK